MAVRATRRSDQAGYRQYFHLSIFKDFEDCFGQAGEAQETREGTGGKGGKKWKLGGGGWGGRGGDFPGPAPICFPPLAFPVLVPLGPEPGIAPVPSAVVQTGALPVELINLTRAIDVSLLKRYGACDVFGDISVPSFFPFIFLRFTL